MEWLLMLLAGIGVGGAFGNPDSAYEREGPSRPRPRSNDDDSDEGGGFECGY